MFHTAFYLFFDVFAAKPGFGFFNALLALAEELLYHLIFKLMVGADKAIIYLLICTHNGVFHLFIAIDNSLGDFFIKFCKFVSHFIFSLLIYQFFAELENLLGILSLTLCKHIFIYGVIYNSKYHTNNSDNDTGGHASNAE